GRDPHHAAAAYGSDQGPGPGLQPFLRAVCLDPPVAADRIDHAQRQGAAAEPRTARAARRPLRMYPLRVMLDGLSQLLVECRPLPWPGDPAPGLPLARR